MHKHESIFQITQDQLTQQEEYEGEGGVITNTGIHAYNGTLIH